jgi:single-strand DNA-binding protein
MKDLNMVFLMGNLTRDPELRYTPNGQAVANFAVATNRSWKDNEGEIKDAVEFTDVVVWGKTAENVANYMKKGRKVHIIGRLQTRSWEAQDGSKRYKTEVVANDVTFLGSKNDAPSGDGVDAIVEDDTDQTPKKESKKGKKKEEKKDEEVDIEDIPF